MEVALVASRSYLARAGTPSTAEDLSARRFLAVHLRGRKVVIPLRARGASRARLVTATPVMHAGDASFVRVMAIEGAGIGVVPRVFVEDDLARGTLVEVLPLHHVDVSVHLHLVHPPLTFAPPKARAFRDFMVSALRW